MQESSLPMKGVSSFKVLVTKLGMKGLRIGVAEKGYNTSKKIGRDDVSWAIHSNGKSYHDNEGKPYCCKLRPKNVVEVILN